MPYAYAKYSDQSAHTLRLSSLNLRFPLLKDTKIHSLYFSKIKKKKTMIRQVDAQADLNIPLFAHDIQYLYTRYQFSKKKTY